VRKRRNTTKQETFFLSSFVWPLLPTRCRCSVLFLHFITVSDAQAGMRAHKRTHTYTNTQCVGLPLTRDRPVAETTQHSQQQDILAPGGIQARNPSKWAAADLRLRPKAETVRKSVGSCRRNATLKTGRSLVFFRRRASKHRKLYTKCVGKFLLFGYQVKMWETAIQCAKWWRVKSV
jgi:hypothetical protein